MCFKEHNRIRIASIYPHTCTSWFDCMIFFSMDPLIDLAKYAMQVCLETFPTWAPHKLFRSRKKRKGKTQNALVRKQTLEWFESTIWGVHVNYTLFQKKMEWDGYVSELFHFSTAQEDMLATPHIPQEWGMFWDNLYDSSISWIAMFIFTLSLTFTGDEQRISVGELVDGP